MTITEVCLDSTDVQPVELTRVLPQLLEHPYPIVLFDSLCDEEKSRIVTGNGVYEIHLTLRDDVDPILDVTCQLRSNDRTLSVKLGNRVLTMWLPARILCCIGDQTIERDATSSRVKEVVITLPLAP